MTNANIDQPRAVRQGEELDLDALHAYLRERVPDLAGKLTVQQFPGGHSNLTYLLRMGDRELVLRRPPFGKKIQSAHDMGREYRILSHLAEVYDRAPRPLVYCEDGSVLGAPFYVMERIKGVILRARVPEGADLNAAVMQGLSENFVDNLVELHAIDYDTIGLAVFGRPAGYVKRQIEGWSKRYQDARTDAIADVERVATWLAGNMPEEAGASLIHGDYKYDNLLLDPGDLTRIIGVLDWEMATIGDPLMDLGTSLAYWVDPNDPDELQALAFGLTTLPGNLNRRELVQRYAQQSGRDVGDGLYYYVYGLFKVVVIAQQIYARHKAGFSQDQRFAAMIQAVRVLGKTAALAIDKGRIDDLSR